MPTADWESGGSPEESYGRVTNPGRFGPLRAFAIGLIDQLERQYVVHRSEASSPSFTRGASFGNSQPIVTLNPANVDGAPLEIAFTSFPGLYVRFGNSVLEPFPSCGCDACAESFESEAERLSWWVAQVTAGRFREQGEDDYEIWDLEGTRRSAGNGLGVQTLYQWQPWTPQ